MGNTLPEKDFLNKTHHQIFGQENQDIKASVLILHGMKEHSGRYRPFAEFLANEGYKVLIYDHPGHGKSTTSEKLGYFRKENPHLLLIEIGKWMSAFLKKATPNKPHIIVGHSMGSFIARNIIKQSAQDYDAAVMIGTGGRRPEIKWMRTLFKNLNSLAHDHSSEWFNQLFDSINSFHFRNEVPFDQNSWLSVDVENRKQYQADELKIKNFSVNGFYGLFSLVEEATQKKWANAIPKDFPMLFVSGKKDPIGNFGKGVEKTVFDLKKNGFSNVYCKLYEEMRHEILNEAIKETVYQDIVNWMNQQVENKNFKNI